MLFPAMLGFPTTNSFPSPHKSTLSKESTSPSLGSPESFSIVIIFPDETRYCFPPVSITANMALASPPLLTCGFLARVETGAFFAAPSLESFAIFFFSIGIFVQSYSKQQKNQVFVLVLRIVSEPYIYPPGVFNNSMELLNTPKRRSPSATVHHKKASKLWQNLLACRD